VFERLRPGGKWFPWALLALLALFQLLCVPGHYIGHEHDDVQYLLAARSLLEGRYSLGILPGDPPLTIASPGWPLLLTPAAFASGDHPLGYQLWAWGWLVLCDGLLFFWLRRRFGDGLAGAATALFALNPLVLSRAGVLMNEIPYLAFVLCAFLSFERGKSIPGWAAGLLLAYSWLIRTASIVLVPPVLGYYALRRRWRDFAAACGMWLGAVVVWKLWSDWGGAGLAESAELAGTFGRDGLGVLWASLTGNTIKTARLLGGTLLPWRPYPGTPDLAAALGFCALAFSGWGLFVRARREGFEVPTAYFVCGVLLHAVWPYWYERYLPPFLPVLILGWAHAFERLRPHRAAVVIALLALSTVPGQGTVLVRRQHLRYRPALSETYAAIREHSPPDALFASAFYCRDAYYAGRPFVPLPTLEGSLAGHMKSEGVDFILWQGVPDLGSSLGGRYRQAQGLARLQSELEGEGFSIFYKNLKEKVVVYGLAENRQKSP
jgi:hypothetical protein